MFVKLLICLEFSPRKSKAFYKGQPRLRWKVDTYFDHTPSPACQAPGQCDSQEGSTFCEYNYGIPKPIAWPELMPELSADLVKKSL